MSFTNQQVAQILRSVSTAMTIKKRSIFEIRAYENAASSIEHLNASLEDLVSEDRIGDIPGVGKSIQAYLKELFQTGEVEHFAWIEKDIPKVVFELINVPGIGPKTAWDLSEYGIEGIGDLEKKIKNGSLVKAGFSAKIAEKIMGGIEEYHSLGDRMLLVTASSYAEKILEYLKKSPDVERADVLGSLRRMVPTIGDLDFAVSSKHPQKVVDYFIQMPTITEVINKGKNKATVFLSGGIHVDILVGEPESYGALLQHFTGSKMHNIHLRSLAEKAGYSLSEYGVKDTKSNTLIQTPTEEALYRLLDMQTPPAELREDTGEIEASSEKSLPSLIQLTEIKGDLHTHSNYPFSSPSHAPGAEEIEKIIQRGIELGYEYIGIADHPPGFTVMDSKRICEEIKKRTGKIEKLKKEYIKGNKSIRVLNGLEIDILPNGTLSVPDKALATLDYCIAGIHSSHKMASKEMTERILHALENPHVDILAHPTGRILNQRISYEADWEKIFEYCAKNHKLLEIDGYPNRLDLREDLVRMAAKFGCKFVIDTDAHAVFQMDNMPYGVSVARRGWSTQKEIVNSWAWKNFSEWFGL